MEDPSRARWDARECERVPSMGEVELREYAERLNRYLSMRSFIEGYGWSERDELVFVGLTLNPHWGEFRRGKYVNLFRWYGHCRDSDEFMGRVSEKLEGRVSESRKEKKCALKPLPGAEMGRVVTRFPPEPSGFLHIGHCKALLLNYEYARQYQGRFLVRFDDTNPSKERESYVEGILEDLEQLEIAPDAVSYTSDYFPLIMSKCEELIRRGLAYCDGTPVEEMRRQKAQRVESGYRSSTVEQNLAIWEQMKLGTPEGRMYVVRAKIDMNSLNGTLRDPSLYRVNVDVPHIRTGRQYNVYPLYDFSCPIVDSVEGVTHVLRSSEFHDRDEQYAWILRALGYPPLSIVDFSRLNFTYQLLSKRKLQWFVDSGRVDGWDDPRFPTLRGLHRRGLTVQALKQFILTQGASKNINLMDMSKVWAINRAVIDPIVPRYTAVAKQGAVPFVLADGPARLSGLTRPLHKKNPSLGSKVIHCYKRVWIEAEDAALLSPGEEVTFMDWGNAFASTILKDQDGRVVEIQGHLNLLGDFKKTKRKLTWLADLADLLVDVQLVEYDHLICKPSLSESDNFEDFLNPVTIYRTPCYGDPNLRTLQKGQSIQLERRGYFICEKPLLSHSGTLILISIPDGSQSGPSILSHKVQLKTK
ncbi:uncharacterized protein LOC126326029 [Schistocerca gregaria]|uniref:uncharacterized protein LOC126326029 n=1 Tax=Schistocerca gregaria TaxID=7010 RepID=UPI00211E74C5|nr:uncharacterized protein LOC126326029 [Schistocerca gregaria]